VADFEKTVFVNCPFDEQYAPLLEAAVFCIVYFGFVPRLANERVESGESRLDKIVEMIRSAKYSLHDLSRRKSAASGEFMRMNMPFELGVDFGMRQSGSQPYNSKKFLIFEETQYDLKKSLSDMAGQDVEHHRGNFELVIRRVRDFFRVEAGIVAPGPSRIISDYSTFQGWMTEKKIFEGHSEKEALTLPTKERVEEMVAWNAASRPTQFWPSAPLTSRTP
jgi:hypothetical protein